MPLTIHEPSPTFPHQIPFGRGGAGNRTTTKPSSKPTTPSTFPYTTHTQSAFPTGRGGAGNMRPMTSSPNTGARSERRIFSFDEELERERRREGVPVYHIGRGGVGNLVDEGVEKRREGSGSTQGSGSGGRGSLEWARGVVGGRKGSGCGR